MKNNHFLNGRRVVYVLGFIFVMGAFFSTTKDIEAKERPAYTIRQGKSKNIETILKYNPLTSEEFKKKYKNLKWRSLKKKVVSVKGKKIKGLKKGKTYIKGYKKKKLIIKLKVTVGTPVSKLKVRKTSYTLNAGKKVTLKTSVYPKKASNKKLFFRSSDTEVATVTTKGTIKTNAGGTAKITVQTKDGSKKKTVKVVVKPELTRMTTYGKVKGKTLAKSLVWYGIPYGASTAGNNRWKAPRNPAAWSGEKNCKDAHAEAAQYGDGNTTYSGTEDCLFVNVFRPNSTDKNLPVMVYLHGGGNASSNSNRNLSSIAKNSNAVVVSVEYRLGAFGFINHPALKTGSIAENSGNFTLLDIQKALQWVQANAANFGGNRGNVTLSGFSAGARDVMFCVISPIMKGLFHKAISFSGGMKTCTPAQGEESANEKLAKILVQRGTYPNRTEALAYVESASNEEIRALFYSLSTAEVANMYSSPQLILSNFPQGFTDGVVLPSNGFRVIASGQYNRVPMILGSNESEFSKYAISSNYTNNGVDTSSMQKGSELLETVAASVTYGSMLQARHYVEEAAETIFSDHAHQPVYGYRFRWGEDSAVSGDFYSQYIGAYHGADVNFLCENYSNPYPGYAPNAISNDNLAGRKALTAKMQTYIKKFLSSGNPNGKGLASWPQWNAGGGNRLMIFDATKTAEKIAASNQYYRDSDIFNTMKRSLTKARYETLVKSAFAGRFFMPDNVPDY